MNNNINIKYINSFLTLESEYETIETILKDLNNARKNSKFIFEKISENELEKWYFDDLNGNLRHESGKFFSIEGLEIRDEEKDLIYYQPIINQCEHGILGLITKEKDGIAYFLVQFKVEPGNIDKVQISPTVQATKSNYTKIHKGKSVPYIDYFLGNCKAKTIFKLLESEQGTKFYKKRNYNIIVELINDDSSFELLPGFKWLTLGQIFYLLKFDNIVNMDLRSIISNIKFSETNLDESDFIKIINSKKSNNFKGKADLFFSGMNEDLAVNSTLYLQNWLKGFQIKKKYASRLVELNKVYSNGWSKDTEKIFSINNPNFELNYLRISAEGREISQWTQPIVADNNTKINGFLLKKIKGIYHLLVQACEEPGSYKGAEIGPTVHNLSLCNPDLTLSFSKYFLNTEKKDNVIYSQMLSEEGGRFYKVQNRYMVAVIDEELELTNRYKWMTLYQLKQFLHKEVVNVEARTLVSCLFSGGDHK